MNFKRGEPDVSLPSGTDKKFSKPVEKMSEAELRTALSELGAVIGDLSQSLEDAKKADPFWYYEPSVGDVTPEARQILEKYLKPEDIPKRLDGQIDVLASTANTNLVSGGNQSGKTTVCSIRKFIRACRVVPPTLKGIFPEKLIPKKKFNRFRVVCEDYTHGFLNHNLPVYKSWVPREWLIDGKWEKSYSDKKDMLTLVHPDEKQICASIEFMTNQADVDSFQGPPMDGITYDEEPRQDIREENLLRMVTAEFVDEMFGMTPTKGLSWVFDEIYENEGTSPDGTQRIQCFQLSSLSNKRANLKTLDEILSRIKIYDHRRMRLLGAWISMSGLIYGGLYHRKDHVIDPKKLVPDGGYLTCRCRRFLENPNADARTIRHEKGCPYLQWLVFRGLDPHLVKETASLFLAMDREGTHVIDTCYWHKRTTKDIKADLNALGRGYRMAWTRCDPSADSDLTALDDRNIFKELSTGPDKIPRLKKAQKYGGSIKAGVDQIMQLLAVNSATGRPSLLIADRPENELIMKAFRSLQREEHANEDRKGVKDAIAEGKFDMHACLRYILQQRLYWRPHDEFASMPALPNEPEGSW